MNVKDLIKYLKKNLSPDDLCFSYDTMRGEHNLLCESEIIKMVNGRKRVSAFTVSGRRIDY